MPVDIALTDQDCLISLISSKSSCIQYIFSMDVSGQAAHRRDFARSVARSPQEEGWELLDPMTSRVMSHLHPLD